MQLDTTSWSGDGEFTAQLIDAIRAVPHVVLLRVEDAPASRAETAFSFISNELFVAFARTQRRVRTRRFGIVPVWDVVSGPLMTLTELEQALTAVNDIGAPDYSDGGMLQYLRTQRIIPPYQTRGVKLVELVRIYEAGATPRAGA